MNFESKSVKNTMRADINRKRNGFRKGFQKSSEKKIDGIFGRSRLSEQDLENYRQQILEVHRRKNHKVLAVISILIFSLGIVIYFILA